MNAFWFGTACGQVHNRYIHYSDNAVSVEQQVDRVEIENDCNEVSVVEQRNQIVITLDADIVDVGDTGGRLLINTRPDDIISEH